MKKKNLLLLLLSAFLILSCSSDDSDSSENTKRPKKYTVQEANESPFSLNFEYSGNNITKIINSDGGIININYNSNNQVTNYSNNGDYNVTYENNLITEIRLTDNTEYYLFEYNAENQIIQSTEYEDGFTTITDYQSDGNNNIIESSDYYSTFKFIYDNSNSPFKDVFPQVDAGIGWFWFKSLVNNQIEVQEKIGSNGTFETKYTYEYTLDSDNFPTERRQISPNGTLRETVTYEYY